MNEHLLDLTRQGAGYASLAIFLLAYVLVTAEDTLRLRKSTPVMVAAGIMWALVAYAYGRGGRAAVAVELFRHNLLDFAELFLFILAAMTYVNTMQEIGLFDAIRAWLIRRRFSLRAIFWIGGLLAFFISAAADNLTTALFMSTMMVAMGGQNTRFVAAACINVVVAANAGGTFSPFGDITTLMVWQKGVIPFGDFFTLFLPALVNWLVPAALMSFTIPDEQPGAGSKQIKLRRGAWMVVALFAVTIALAVWTQHTLHLPPVLGMMTGMGLLKGYVYFLSLQPTPAREAGPRGPESLMVGDNPAIDTYKVMERTEWDTLIFFYGILLCVGALEALGYLALVSQALYVEMTPSIANIGSGVLSAVIDNIPLMFAVLTMHPDMSQGQWLLITLTVGVGGSLLSIGSAAGVAVMGQARGLYTFAAHLRWTWAIALGYAASIATHFLLNAESFHRSISIMAQ